MGKAEGELPKQGWVRKRRRLLERERIHKGRGGMITEDKQSQDKDGKRGKVRNGTISRGKDNEHRDGHSKERQSVVGVLDK